MRVWSASLCFISQRVEYFLLTVWLMRARNLCIIFMEKTILDANTDIGRKKVLAALLLYDFYGYGFIFKEIKLMVGQITQLIWVLTIMKTRKLEVPLLLSIPLFCSPLIVIFTCFPVHDSHFASYWSYLHGKWMGDGMWLLVPMWCIIIGTPSYATGFIATCTCVPVGLNRLTFVWNSDPPPPR